MSYTPDQALHIGQVSMPPVLPTAEFEKLEPQLVASLFLRVMAERAVVFKGKLLRLPEFNIRPDVNFNLALGLGISDTVRIQIPEILNPRAKIAIAAIESSGTYLTFGFAQGLQKLVNGADNLKIHRIRRGLEPSVMLDASRVIKVPTHPITSGLLEPEAVRWLHAELPEEVDRDANIAIIVDDVEATGSSRRGAEVLIRKMFPRAQIVTCTAFKKVEQQESPDGDSINVTLLPIEHFGWDNGLGHAVLLVSGFKPQTLQRVTQEDFIE